MLQRLGLVQKGLHPDVLAMTATPISRARWRCRRSMAIWNVSIIDISFRPAASPS